MSTARIAKLLKVSRQFTLWFLFLCGESGISPHTRINIHVSALLVMRQELHLLEPEVALWCQTSHSLVTDLYLYCLERERPPLRGKNSLELGSCNAWGRNGLPRGSLRKLAMVEGHLIITEFRPMR